MVALKRTGIFIRNPESYNASKADRVSVQIKDMNIAKKNGLDDDVSSRDRQCMQDVGEMQDLGKFDQEFTMYGVSYLDDNQVHYAISAKADKIYRFISELSAKGSCTGFVEEITEVYPVPSGLQEVIAQSVKMDLAKKIQQQYPVDFYQLLERYNQAEHNDNAFELISGLQQKLDGVFEENKLQLFEGLLDLAYQSKVLTKTSHQKFKFWLAKTRKDMEDDVIIKDVNERTFYGIAYRDANGKLKYIYNALLEQVELKKYQFEKAGLIVSPILEKTFWYNYEYVLLNARQDFEKYLKKVYDENYMLLVEKIKNYPSNIDAASYHSDISEWLQRYETANRLLELAENYKRKWNIIR